MNGTPQHGDRIDKAMTYKNSFLIKKDYISLNNLLTLLNQHIMGLRTFLESLLKKIENFKPVLPSLNKSQKPMNSAPNLQSFVRENSNQPKTNRYVSALKKNDSLFKYDQSRDSTSLAAHSTDTMGRNHSSKTLKN